MRSLRSPRKALITLAVVGATATLLTAPASAGKHKKEAATQQAAPIATLKDAGLSFEAAMALPEADRKTAMESLNRALGTVKDNESTDEGLAAARYLFAEIRYQVGDVKGSIEEFRAAEGQDSKGAYADDAAFAAIQALEQSGGNDKEAQRAWLDWETRYPQSPLV